MRLTKNTMQILQNYTMINPSILIEPGNVIRTVDAGKTVIGRAEVEENFPQEFAIYDLPNFLQVIKMFDGADIQFEDNHCLIKYDDSNTIVRYMFAVPEAVETVKKDIVMPPTEINFQLSESQLASIIKAATTMSLNQLVISPDENAVILTVTDIDNSHSNNFRIKVQADLEISDFDVVIEMSKLVNLFPGSYNVGISSKKLSHFLGDNLQYWVALNTNSKF